VLEVARVGVEDEQRPRVLLGFVTLYGAAQESAEIPAPRKPWLPEM
jgi:hypothetical protein